MDTAQKKKGSSWGVIILMIFLFWPVGIYLLVRKVTSDKRAALANSKAIMAMGFVLIALAIFYVIVFANAGARDPEAAALGDVWPLLLFFVIGGIVLVYTGARMKKNALRYRRYIAVVVNQGEASVSNIAKAMGVTHQQVVKDLNKMIEIGYFEQAYYDEGRGELVMPSHTYEKLMEEDPTLTSEGSANRLASTESGPRVIVCKSCGAQNTVRDGGTHECEFCGSPLP